MNDNVVKNLRMNIIKQRKIKGCSTRLLSELIGCDSSYISKVEKGKITPSIDKIISIANYFNINFIELFED